MRKYLVLSPTRQAHFFGQAAIESSFLARMIESSVDPARNPTHASLQSETNGYYRAADQYFNQYEFRLGNVSIGDGVKFRGRGMKQLTALENYSKYWVYRAWLSPLSFDIPWFVAGAERSLRYKNSLRTSPNINDPERLSIDDWNCVDAGGWYWEAGSAQARFKSINQFIAEWVLGDSEIRTVTRAINGGENALSARNFHTKRIAEILMDFL